MIHKWNVQIPALSGEKIRQGYVYLPEGYEEQGVMGSPLEEGGGWYSYVRKYYVNKAENTRIYFEYETYAIDTESGYEDSTRTVCSFYNDNLAF